MKKVLALILMVSSPAFAEGPAKPKDMGEVQVVEGYDCASGAEKRRLEVLTRGPGCTTQYTKGGKASEVAAAKNGVDVCKSALARVKKKLEDSGYKCQ